MSDDFEVDLEKGRLGSEEESRKCQEKQGISSLGSFVGDKPVSTPKKASGSRETEKPGCGRSGRKEKRKKSASKPPRPPRGPSLDAADHKLIREIAELAMLKRAKIERMRALKKSKAAKAASAASSVGNILAMVFTLLFCFVVMFQGMSSREASGSLGKKSPMAADVRENGDLVSVTYMGNPRASEPDIAYIGEAAGRRLSGLPKEGGGGGGSILGSNRKMGVGNKLISRAG